MCHPVRAIRSVLRHSAADKRCVSGISWARIFWIHITWSVRKDSAATEPESSCHGDAVCSSLLRWRVEPDYDWLWVQEKACLYCTKWKCSGTFRVLFCFLYTYLDWWFWQNTHQMTEVSEWIVALQWAIMVWKYRISVCSSACCAACDSCH